MRISASISTGLGLKRRDHAPVPANGVEPPVCSNLPAVIDTNVLQRQAAAPDRPVAALVAQLIAHIEDMPATRALRRADAGYGANTYQSVADLGPQVEARTARVI